jgi:hypothetical protein
MEFIYAKKPTPGDDAMNSKLDWALLILCLVIIFLCVLTLITGRAQDVVPYGEVVMPEDVISPEVEPFMYDGWQDGTTLRSNKWNAAEGEPPEANERLYIYKDGIKQEGHYEWDGYKWNPRNGAYTNRPDR